LSFEICKSVFTNVRFCSWLSKPLSENATLDYFWHSSVFISCKSVKSNEPNETAWNRKGQRWK